MERVRVVVCGTVAATEAMGILLKKSQSFHFDPYPDDLYCFQVWPDCVRWIEHLKEEVG